MCVCENKKQTWTEDKKSGYERSYHGEKRFRRERKMKEGKGERLRSLGRVATAGRVAGGRTKREENMNGNRKRQEQRRFNGRKRRIREEKGKKREEKGIRSLREVEPPLTVA